MRGNQGREAEFHTGVMTGKNRDHICGVKTHFVNWEVLLEAETGSRSEIGTQLWPSEFTRMLGRAWDFSRAHDEGGLNGSYLGPKGPCIPK